MAHEIHIAHILAYLFVFEGVAFLLTSAILLAKWTRYYRNPFYRGSFPGRAFKSAWSVVFTSEVRLFEFLPLFAVLNVVGVAVLATGFVAHYLGLSFSW